MLLESYIVCPASYLISLFKFYYWDWLLAIINMLSINLFVTLPIPGFCKNFTISLTFLHFPISDPTKIFCVPINWFSPLWFIHSKLSIIVNPKYCHNPSQSPSPKSNSKVQVKIPSLKSKVKTLNLKDLDLEWLCCAVPPVSKFYSGLWQSRVQL